VVVTDRPSEVPPDDGPDGARNGEHRKGKRRSRTIPMRRLSREEVLEGIRLSEELEYERPKTRGACIDGPRPCPFVSCIHHLFLDINPQTGSIKLNFPDLEVWEMKESCALDVADRGGSTLEEVGAIMNLTRERIRQLEARGLQRLQQADFAIDIRKIFI
jgi:hypothetical protein